MSSGQALDGIVTETVAALKEKLSVFYFLGDNLGGAPEQRLYECASTDSRKPDGISKRWCMDFHRAVYDFDSQPTRLKATQIFLLVSHRFGPFVNDPAQASVQTVLRPTLQVNDLRKNALSAFRRTGALPMGTFPPIEPLDKETAQKRLNQLDVKMERQDVHVLLSLCSRGLLSLGFASAANDTGKDELAVAITPAAEETEDAPVIDTPPPPAAANE